jgi:hypothetical protein
MKDATVMIISKLIVFTISVKSCPADSLRPSVVLIIADDHPNDWMHPKEK